MAFANLAALYVGVLAPCMARSFATIYPAALLQSRGEEIPPPYAVIDLLAIAKWVADICAFVRGPSSCRLPVAFFCTPPFAFEWLCLNLLCALV